MCTASVSNSQGRNLGRSVTLARTSGLSSIQGDLGESGQGNPFECYFCVDLVTTKHNLSPTFSPLLPD